jgi:hypothetical protein
MPIRMKPLSSEELENRFRRLLNRHHFKVYNGRELNSMAETLHLPADEVRAKLRSAGFSLVPSGSGSRRVWKKSPSQSPHNIQLEE